MPPVRIAVPTAVFSQPLRKALESAAVTGATGVQFDIRSEVKPAEFGDTARRQLLHYCSELGLAVAATTLPSQGGLADFDRLEARVAAVRQGMEFTRQRGASVLTVRLGRIPADADSREAHRLLDVVGDLARHGNKIGTTVALSTLGNPPEALASLLTAVSREGPLGLDFDPAGFVFAGVTPPTALRELHPFVRHLQVRDGERTADGAGVETAVGAGQVPWDELLATVEEAGYRGWLTVRRTGGEDPAHDVARGVQYVRNVAFGR